MKFWKTFNKARPKIELLAQCIPISYAGTIPKQPSPRLHWCLPLTVHLSLTASTFSLRVPFREQAARVPSQRVTPEDASLPLRSSEALPSAFVSYPQDRPTQLPLPPVRPSA